MKKKNVINLIRYHAEKNEAAFREEVYEIAKYFDSIKDYELSEYIMSLMSNANVFSPQMIEDDFKYLKKVEIGNESIPLPDALKDSVLGIINAIGHRAGVNKFLFEGPPGTGKTETAKQIARILERELYVVDFDLIIDSKLGQTSKNISALFSELQRIPSPDNVIVLFDEIDVHNRFVAFGGKMRSNICLATLTYSHNHQRLVSSCAFPRAKYVLNFSFQHTFKRIMTAKYTFFNENTLLQRTFSNE